MHAPSLYQPSRSLFAKIKRRVTQYRHAEPANIVLDRPILSITFDDCPHSAIEKGAAVLDRHGVKGCFYIATDLLGEDSPMGPMTTADAVRQLAANDHEIGAHSHSHVDYAQSPLRDVKRDIEKNLQNLKKLCGVKEVESFAFPYGETSFEAKQELADRFTNLRGLLPGVNRGRVDRAQLRAFELDGRPDCVDTVLSELNGMVENPGWMIIFTHDVSETPSQFGTTPDALETIITTAKSLGVEICTPAIAARKIGMTD